MAKAAPVVVIAIGILSAPGIFARMAFDAASVKLSTGEFVPPNVPLNAGNAYSPTGGYFRADAPLSVYIEFAYKLWPTEEESRQMLARLPNWVSTDRYTLEARAAGNPTKDQMRLMVQSLLADRFGLKVHMETRELRVFVLTLVSPGKLGPTIIPHSAGRPCGDSAAAPARDSAHVFRGADIGPETFPPMCDSAAAIRKASGMLLGYRNATMDLLTNSLSAMVFSRRVIDKTGLKGSFDFTLEWAPDNAPASDVSAATAVQAVREQLGMKVESAKRRCES